MAYPTDVGTTYNQVTPSQELADGTLSHSELHNALATEVQALKDKVGVDGTGALSVLEDAVDTLEDAVDAVETDVDTIQSDVSALQGDVQPLAQINFQAISTNSVLDQAYIQYGWGFIEGNGTGLITASISFPVTFGTAIYTLGATHLGNKNSTPTAIGDLTVAPSAGVSFTAVPSSPTTSGFTMNLVRSTGNFASGNYYGFSWWALGK